MLKFIRPITDEEAVVEGDTAIMPCPDGTAIEVVAANWAASLTEEEREEYGHCLWWAYRDALAPAEPPGDEGMTFDRNYWEKELNRLSGLSCEAFGEPSNGSAELGRPGGAKDSILSEIAAALRDNRRPQIRGVLP